MQGGRESKSETLEGKGSKASNEVEKLSHSGDNLAKQVKLKAEAEYEEQARECSASEDVGNRTEVVVSENEPSVEKKVLNVYCVCLLSSLLYLICM